MTHRLVSPLACLLLFTPTTFAAAPTAPTTAPTSPATLYDAALLSGDTQTLWDHASPALRTAIGSPDKLASLRSATLGPHPTANPHSTTTLTRTASNPADGTSFRITYTVDDTDGQLVGLFIQPSPDTEAPTKFLNYQTQATCRLPFTGSWTVAWGGRTVKQNYHAAYPDQRFAYDLFIKKNGSTHTGDGKNLEDYYCYNQPILSPAAATVVEATDTLPDNPPGHMDPQHALGNHLILDLGHSEFLFLCHLKPHTLKVKKGDHLTPAQPLALCGNSGNTSEPHLHTHLQTTPTPFQGQGLPLQFQHYTADDHPIDRGEPTRNQVIHPQ